MIQIEIIPDGAASLPTEARDHGILATHLENNNADIKGNNSVVIDWRGVERVVQQDRMYLRAQGTLADYQQMALDAMTNAIVNNINGVKAHPDGWQEVDEQQNP